MKGVFRTSGLLAALATKSLAQNASMPVSPGVNNTNIATSIVREVNQTRGPALEEVHY